MNTHEILVQHPAQLPALLPHSLLMLRLYGCTYFPTGHTLFNVYVASLAPLIHSCILRMSERVSCLCMGVWINGAYEQIYLWAPLLRSPLLAISHNEGFIWWRVRDDAHLLRMKEVLS